MLKKHLLFFICLLTSLCSFSQSKVLKGSVVDEMDNPIEGVHIKLLGKRNNAITNSDGEFRIRISDVNFKIEVSHLSYRSKTISLNTNKLKDDVKVVLVSKINSLDEIIIGEKSYDMLTGSAGKHIYDYEVNENLIYILSELAGHNYLEVWSDDLLNQKRIRLDFVPVELVIDCFRNVHIQSEHETRQILLKSEDIIVLESRSIDEYNSFIKPCVSDVDSMLIFTYINTQKKEQYYYSIDKTNFEVNLIHTIKDSALAVANVDPIKALEFIKMVDRSNSTGVPLLVNENKCLFQMGRSMIHFEVLLNNHLLTTPENPFYKQDSTFLIIDQVNGVGINFSKKTHDSISSIPFSFHQVKGFKNKILKDQVKGKFYSVNEIKDKITIIELNELFETNGEFVIKNHSFPEQIKVNRGFIYYLVKNNKDYIPHNELVRVKLPNRN